MDDYTFQQIIHKPPLIINDFSKVSTINNLFIHILGYIDTTIYLPNGAVSLPLRLYVIKEEIPKYHFILGLDFVVRNFPMICIEPPSYSLRDKKGFFPFKLYEMPSVSKTIQRTLVYITQPKLIRARTQTLCSSSYKSNPEINVGSPGLFTAIPFERNTVQLLPIDGLVTTDKNRLFKVIIVNSSLIDVIIPKNTLIGYIENIESIHEHSLDTPVIENITTNNTTDMSNKQNSIHINSIQANYNLPADINLENCVIQDDKDALKELNDLLKRNLAVFAKNTKSPNSTNLVEHTINTGDSLPFKMPLYRQSPVIQNTINDHVQQMLKDGIIEHSDSPWSSNIIIVKKKDGSDRLVVDFRKLNEVTTKDAFPLPLINEMLDLVGSAKFISTLDLASGYWQIPMSKKDAPKTAFSTRSGHFQFKRMPFGLTNAPATFQRFMNRVLSGLTYSFCMVYLDDVIIYSNSISDHLNHLQLVFDRLALAGLTLKASKCQLFRSSVSFLGHTISSEGIKPDQSKLKVIADWPTPSNIKEVRSFLGLVNYYRRFIPSLANIADPLYRLTRKSIEYKWNNQCEEAFIVLKNALMSEPILRPPDPSKKFIIIIITDASNIGLGAILAQYDPNDKRDHAISYIGKLLSKPQKNYSVMERECLAVIWAVRQFRSYIYGQEFIILTDHSALRWLFSQKEPIGRIARWITAMMEHSFKVIHRSGEKHSNADALSRVLHVNQVHPAPEIDIADDLEQNEADQSFDISAVRNINDYTQLFYVQQRTDKFSHSIILYLQSNKTTYPPSLKTEREKELYANERINYILYEDLLYYVDPINGVVGRYTARKRMENENDVYVNIDVTLRDGV